MSIVRRLSKVIGPGAPGFLIIAFGKGQTRFTAEVSADNIPPMLCLPNSEFVSVLDGRTFLRIESKGRDWTEIQDSIRLVLNKAWDPIGVADQVDDEYDGYIADLYALLLRSSAREDIADRLRTIETESMGLPPSSANKLLSVADQLKGLHLPRVG